MSVDEWILVLTAAVLVVGIVAAVGAVLAAKYARPGWKASKAKPDLRFEAQPGTPTSAQFHLVLSNDGDGAAADWKLTLVMPPETGISAYDIWPRGVPGWATGGTDEYRVASWMSTSADDTIGPGLHRSMMVSTNSPTTIEATYTVQATGMKERTGHFRVTIGEDPKREQTIEIT